MNQEESSDKNCSKKESHKKRRWKRYLLLFLLLLFFSVLFSCSFTVIRNKNLSIKKQRKAENMKYEIMKKKRFAQMAKNHKKSDIKPTDLVENAEERQNTNLNDDLAEINHENCPEDQNNQAIDDLKISVDFNDNLEKSVDSNYDLEISIDSNESIDDMEISVDSNDIENSRDIDQKDLITFNDIESYDSIDDIENFAESYDYADKNQCNATNKPGTKTQIDETSLRILGNKNLNEGDSSSTDISTKISYPPDSNINDESKNKSINSPIKESISQNSHYSTDNTVEINPSQPNNKTKETIEDNTSENAYFTDLSIEQRIEYVDKNFTFEKFIADPILVKKEMENKGIFNITSVPISILEYLKTEKKSKSSGVLKTIKDFGTNLFNYATERKTFDRKKLLKDFKKWKRILKRT